MKSVKEMLAGRTLYTAKSGSNIVDVICYMAEHNLGIVPVLDADDKLLGVFSERDLVRRVIAKKLDLNSTLIDNVMTKDLIIADVNESYQKCFKK